MNKKFLSKITTKKLLLAGLVASIMFPLVVFILASTRKGFDINLLPLSLLSVGDLGWIHIANSIIAGLLTMLFAIGMKRQMITGPGKKWAPRLIGIYGATLVASGIFITDPMYGFPPGTPPGLPTVLSWHAIIHNLTFIVLFSTFTVTQFIFLRRFAYLKRWGWFAYCLIMIIATPVLIVIANMTPSMFGTILFATNVISNFWLVLIAKYLLSEKNKE